MKLYDDKQIRSLQLRLLEIVDAIDSLCKKNNIKYYLIGGSALGAVRHGGFIPWDDDFDIAMEWSDYCKFLKLCKVELDLKKFYIEKENTEEWPLYFSKIKLNDTIFREKELSKDTHPGIFVDVFSIENISDNEFIARWQYFCSKIAIAQSLSRRGYETATLKKKIVLKIIKMIFKSKKFDNFFVNQVRKYNKEKTERIGVLFGITKYRTSIFPKKVFGESKKIKFEERNLPVPKEVNEYLSGYFGDYLKLPPEENRRGHMPEELKI